jgi:predicted metal-dependent hydrolase
MLATVTGKPINRDVGLLSILFPASRRKADPQGRKRVVAVSDLLAPGQATDVRVTRNPRAQRISLRVDPTDGAVALTVPWHVSVEEGLRFAKRQSGWLRARLTRVPAAAPFVDGAEFELLGARVRVRHGGKGPAKLADGELRVGGDPAFVALRVRDFLKGEARRVLAAKSRAAAARLGKTVKSVRIADPKSRWGSAARDGRLSFSWRLVLTPEFVCDYVVAHEVAHLAHMDHSPRFWAAVAALYGDPARAKAWLAANGAALHRHG